MAHKTSLDLVLINPSNRVQVYQSLGKKLAAVEPPVWAGLMASFARKRGCSVAILDAEAEGLTPDQVATRVEEMKPLLAAVVVYGHQPSASTQNMTGCHAVCTAIKAALPETETASRRRPRRRAAGAHREGGTGRFRCRRRGAVHAGRTDRSAAARRQPDLSKVRGLWYRDGKAIRRNNPAGSLANLDARDAGHRLGPAADGQLPRPQLALLRRT